jgi:hypothetical protein
LLTPGYGEPGVFVVIPVPDNAVVPYAPGLANVLAPVAFVVCLVASRLPARLGPTANVVNPPTVKAKLDATASEIIFSFFMVNLLSMYLVTCLSFSTWLGFIGELNGNNSRIFTLI